MGFAVEAEEGGWWVVDGYRAHELVGDVVAVVSPTPEHGSWNERERGGGSFSSTEGRELY